MIFQFQHICPGSIQIKNVAYTKIGIRRIVLPTIHMLYVDKTINKK